MIDEIKDEIESMYEDYSLFYIIYGSILIIIGYLSL